MITLAEGSRLYDTDVDYYIRCLDRAYEAANQITHTQTWIQCRLDITGVRRWLQSVRCLIAPQKSPASIALDAGQKCRPVRSGRRAKIRRVRFNAKPTPPAEHPAGSWPRVRTAMRKWTDAVIPVLIGTGATSLLLFVLVPGGVA